MNEDLMKIENYAEYKKQLDGAMHQAADAFVRIGYLLRVAQDTNILQESNYISVNDMAKAEYGLSPDQVSRYIAINKRFSEGGYSDRLKDNMQGYGIAKLQIMITMSDEVVDAIPQETTKQELMQIQKEIKEENKKTDIEVMLETKEQKEESNLRAFLKNYFKTNVDAYLKMYEGCKERKTVETLLNALAPTGINILRTRVPGTGMLMLTIKGEDNPAVLVNVRTNEKEEYDLKQIVEEFSDTYVDKYMDAKYMYMEVLRTEWPKAEESNNKTESDNNRTENAKIAPVQEEKVQIEVVPGVKVEIEDMEKAQQAAEKEIIKAEIVADSGNHCEEREEESKKSESLLREMKTCVNTSLGNVTCSVNAKAYKAALEDAKNLVHYLEKVVEMER